MNDLGTAQSLTESKELSPWYGQLYGDASGKVSTYYATSVTDSAGQVTRVKEGAIWP